MICASGTRAPASLPASQRKLKVGTTLFMLAMHVGAVFALLPRFWSWQGLVAFGVLYWMTVLGVTLGLHRLMAHRSFEAPKWLERVLVVMGTLGCQGGPVEWVGLHRHHHKFSDQPNDHHDAGRGLWWSHSEWMLHSIPALKHWIVSLAICAAIPSTTGLIASSCCCNCPWARLSTDRREHRRPRRRPGLGAVGHPLRLTVVYHVTWLVNSATHVGATTSIAPTAPPTAGGGDPQLWRGLAQQPPRLPPLSRHGLRWFEFDITWQHIRASRAWAWPSAFAWPTTGPDAGDPAAPRA